MENSKNRHGCLTAYLIFMLIANSAVFVMYLTSSEAIIAANPSMPQWAIPVLMFFGTVNVICAVMLFKLKRSGFYGFVVSAIIVFFLNLHFGLGIAGSLPGLIGIAILYGVLNIGKDNKGWPQLD